MDKFINSLIIVVVVCIVLLLVTKLLLFFLPIILIAVAVIWIYKKFKNKFYNIYTEYEVMDMIDYNGKIIACSFDNHSCIPIANNSKYIFVDDKTGESRNFIITKNNKIMLQNIPEEYDLEPDITIKNCEIIINPKSNTSIF